MDMSDTYGTTGTQNPGSTGDPTFSTSGQATSGHTADVAKGEAQATGQQVREEAKHVVDVGKEEAKNVAAETGQQAKELWHQTRSELLSQSAQQQTRVAEGLRSLSQELSSMARSSDHQGVASDLASQASQRMSDAAGWLENRDPGSLVTELKQFARRRPGTFLAAAAAIGVVGGRLSRGLVADHQDTNGSGSSTHVTGAGDYPPAVDHSTSGGYSAYGSPRGAAVPAAGPAPVTGDPSPSTAGSSADALSAADPVGVAGRGGAGRDTDANGDEVLR
jgi:hypothetical protein